MAWYKRHDIKVKRVLTDNGACYKSRKLRQACHELGIQHKRTRPYHPPTNGKTERFIRTALKEWAYPYIPTPGNELRTCPYGRIGTISSVHIWLLAGYCPLGLEELASFAAEHFGQYTYIGLLKGDNHNRPVRWSVRIPVDAVENRHRVVIGHPWYSAFFPYISMARSRTVIRLLLESQEGISPVQVSPLSTLAHGAGRVGHLVISSKANIGFCGTDGCGLVWR